MSNFASLFLVHINYRTLSNYYIHQKIDLNGDGKADTIQLLDIDEAGDFILRINKTYFKGSLSDSVNGLSIVDFDENDKYKEIAVHTTGLSSDDEYLILWNDRKNITEMEVLKRWLQFLGNGIIYCDDWMGFLKKREKYILNNETRKLEKIPQELYYTGVEGTVCNNFTIYRTRELKDPIAKLCTGSKALILACYI
ncbi:MAG: hypothetical protein ABIL77_03175, partial [candidate division WOR-3 bacterium]